MVYEKLLKLQDMLAADSKQPKAQCWIECVTVQIVIVVAVGVFNDKILIHRPILASDIDEWVQAPCLDQLLQVDRQAGKECIKCFLRGKVK